LAVCLRTSFMVDQMLAHRFGGRSVEVTPSVKGRLAIALIQFEVGLVDQGCCGQGVAWPLAVHFPLGKGAELPIDAR
jgi:hypothetical protein